MTEQESSRKVMVTGATGFVGRYVVRELVARGFTPVCLVRDAERLRAQHGDIDPDRLIPIVEAHRAKKNLIAQMLKSGSLSPLSSPENSTVAPQYFITT